MISLTRNVQNDERILANIFRVGCGRQAHGSPSCFPLLQLVHDSFRVRNAILGQIQEKLWHGLSVGMSVAFPVGTLNDAPAKLLAEAVASQGNFFGIPRVLPGSELLHQPYYLKLDQVVLVMTSNNVGAWFWGQVKVKKQCHLACIKYVTLTHTHTQHCTTCLLRAHGYDVTPPLFFASCRAQHRQQ